MDAFSRFLAAIGQSLGKGLGKVGETELEQRQRLEALEFQRKANISGQLLQTFTQLLQTQGIQEVEPGGIDAIRQAVTDLALGRVDSPAVQRAIEVFPTVAQAANKIAVYRELATKDLDALSRLVATAVPGEAQRLLKAVGLEGLYEGLRTRGEFLTEADRLGLQLTREQIENLAAQRKALLAKLEPEIRLLDAQLRLVGAQADEILAKLPLVLTRLQLEAQNLAVQIRKGEIEAGKLDQILDAQIKKDLAAVGVSEAQAAVLREQVGLIREQIKSEVLRQAQIEAQTELTKAETELKRAQARQITETLGPTIENLLLDAERKRAEIAGEQARTEEVRARTQAILQRLPLEIESLLLDIKRKGIELEKLPDLLDAELAKRLADIGLTEAQTGLTKEQIELIKQQTKTEILRQLQTEAQTEKIRAETNLINRQAELVAENIKTAAQERGIKLTESATGWIRDIAKLAVELSVDTPERAKELLQGFGNFYNLPEDFISFAANQIATSVKEAKADKDLQRAGALADVIGRVMNTAIAAESPEAAKRVASALLPPSASPELRTLIGNMAYYLKTLRLGSDVAAIIEPYMKMLPPTPEDESRVLRELYDSFIRAKGDTPENRRIANGLVNTIKGQWALMRASQELEREGKKADIDKDKALTALYKVQAALAPKQFALEEQKLALEREEFSFEKWYKTEQVKLGWARLELDKLIAQAKAAETGEDTIKALKDLASAAKAFDDVAVNQLATRLRQTGHSDCADDLKKSGTIGWVEVVARNPNKCNEAVRQILTDRANHGDVIRVVENAVRFGQVVTEMAAQFVGGGPAQPGGIPQPGGAAPGAVPSGTATPKPQDGATGLRRKAAELKQAGVSVPNDPKVAGAMTFIYALEGGPRDNPFQIIPSSGVTPAGPDKGFSAAVRAEPMRAKAIELDSAPALGVSWFLPVLARNPSVKVRYLDPKIVEANRPLFERAKYFGDDGVAVAAAYTAGTLERAGFEFKYTPLFTSLMRVLAENDLSVLRMRKPLSQTEAEKRFLNLVKSRYGSRYKEFGLGSPQELLEAAQKLYQATRLSAIGNLVLGGGR